MMMQAVVRAGRRPEAAEEERILLALGRRKGSSLGKSRPVFCQATSLEILSLGSGAGIFLGRMLWWRKGINYHCLPSAKPR